MESETKQQSKESSDTVSRPTEIKSHQRSRLRAAVDRISTYVGDRLDLFFYDSEAFRFKGIMTFSLHLLTIIGVGVTLQFLSRPASVVVENREPIACFDTALFEENYALQKLSYPQQLRDTIQEVALRNWPKGEFQFTVGAVARGLPLSKPTDIRHQILCWYVTPRSSDRLEEIRRMEAAMSPSVQDSRLPKSKGEWLTRARRMASAEDEPIDTNRQREFSAASFLSKLTDFSTPDAPLNLAAVLRPNHTMSRYRNADAWKEDIRITEISGDSDILNAIDVSGLKDEDLERAYENFDQSRYFLSWVEVSTNSTHAVASKVSIAIARRGRCEVLGGTLKLSPHQRYFTGTIERLLPRERFWALLKTNRPLKLSDVEIATDPTAFFDPHSVLKVVLIIGLVVVVPWVVANVRVRRRERRERKEGLNP